VDAGFWELSRAWRAALETVHAAAAGAESPAVIGCGPAASPEAAPSPTGAAVRLPDDRLVRRGA
jgi:hypothetical protein